MYIGYFVETRRFVGQQWITRALLCETFEDKLGGSVETDNGAAQPQNQSASLLGNNRLMLMMCHHLTSIQLIPNPQRIVIIKP